MPNRIVREGILTSEAVNGLNWAEEVFYRRLLSVVDDFGRYYATPKLLRAACYPLHIDKVSDSDIGKWLSACETAALVRVYPASDGKRYLEVQNFKQQQRAKESKFPSPDDRLLSACIADAQHLQADAHLGVFGVEGVVEDEGESRKRAPKPAGFIPPDWINRAHWDAWHSCAKRRKATDAQKQLAVDKLDSWRQAGEDYAGALENAAVGGWQGLFLPDKGKANPADNKTVTVPTKPGRDPTLVRLEQEALSATKPPPEIRERMAQLTRGAA
jgi:hypothetical protein